MPDDSPQHQAAVGPPIAVMTPPSRQTVWWVMTVVLAVIATALVSRWDVALLSRSAAQSGSPMAGARGIYAFTGQFDSKSYGLFMLDVDTGTMWCYEMEKGRDGQMRLRLAAARSWLFDRYLEEFNVAAPTPSEVKALVQLQQSHAAVAGNVVKGQPPPATAPGPVGGPVLPKP